jgi:hypothetical protein
MYRFFDGAYYNIHMFGGFYFKKKYHWLYVAVGDRSMIRKGKYSGRWSIVDINYIATISRIPEKSYRHTDTILRILSRWYS